MSIRLSAAVIASAISMAVVSGCGGHHTNASPAAGLHPLAPRSGPGDPATSQFMPVLERELPARMAPGDYGCVIAPPDRHGASQPLRVVVVNTRGKTTAAAIIDALHAQRFARVRVQNNVHTVSQNTALLRSLRRQAARYVGPHRAFVNVQPAPDVNATACPGVEVTDQPKSTAYHRWAQAAQAAHPGLVSVTRPLVLYSGKFASG